MTSAAQTIMARGHVRDGLYGSAIYLFVALHDHADRFLIHYPCSCLYFLVSDV